MKTRIYAAPAVKGLIVGESTHITYIIMISVIQRTIFVKSLQLNENVISYSKQFSSNISDPLVRQCSNLI